MKMLKQNGSESHSKEDGSDGMAAKSAVDTHRRRLLLCGDGMTTGA